MTNGIARRAKREIVKIACGMLCGEVDFIWGCRRLCELRYDTGSGDSELFHPIVAFESETDVYPIGDVREHFAPAYLQELDEEITRYTDEAKPWVLAACRRIVEEFGRKTR